MLPVNVLHINASDAFGGAAIAVLRLHEGLLARGVDSRLLVGACVEESARTFIYRRGGLAHRLATRFCQRIGLNELGCLDSFQIRKQRVYKEAEILNFHNLHGGGFSYLAVPRLTRDKPAIFTLHDMWSFTGHCVYSFDCQRWKTGCGRCPYPDTYPAIRCDATWLEWRLKARVYERSKLTIVCPSRWLTQRARESMLGRFAVHHIPYGIDTSVYRPLDKEQCRRALGLPAKRAVLLLSAHNVKDPRKGRELLRAALQDLPSSLKSELLVLQMGNGGQEEALAGGIQSIALGYNAGDRLKVLTYNAADLLILPSLADNLPLVLQEAMACGVPMVAFNVGGVADLVRPGITGALVDVPNIAGLTSAIVELVEDKQRRQDLACGCRRVAVDEFGHELQAERYIKLYRELLQRRPGSTGCAV